MDISRLKTATGSGLCSSVLLPREMFSAMFKANDVFPMPGRAARMIRFAGLSPMRIVSRFRNPVAGYPAPGLFVETFRGY